MFIAGIDGGGTHTRIELRDMENRLLRRGEFGPFNLNAIGESAFRRLLREVFAWCGDMAVAPAAFFPKQMDPVPATRTRPSPSMAPRRAISWSPQSFHFP